MTTDSVIVKPGDKRIVFIRTDTAWFFKISNRRITDEGLIPKAEEVPASYVAELYVRFGIKPTVKGKASRIRAFRKEEIV